MMQDQCLKRTVITEQLKEKLCYGWDRIQQTIYHGYCVYEKHSIMELFYTITEGDAHDATKKISNYQILEASHKNTPAINHLLPNNAKWLSLENTFNTKEEALVMIKANKDEALIETERCYQPAIDYCSATIKKVGIEQSLFSDKS